ncbi:DNA helicase IV [Pedococcus dokdonensis]|uniref:DNA helicase IV n=1 Tax=Pedococcus dokdonensis TaxID=443156 RepID=A0A1H0SMQ4_9MICO|nr:AAA family ATPase [Pedococcus dokdonensis]SDP43007.1 DNA helicase IV [Pedococcus dokdonensis]
MSASAPTPELKSEQDYLGAARAALAAMREQTLSLKVQAHDPISAEHLARTLHLRAASLQDDPSTTLFFGRVDTDTDERWYIGRRHVADSAGDPLVIDWRAGMSTAFYRASRTEPMGVVLRRRFGLDHGAITAYEDEHLQDRAEHDVRSQILAEEIERPRVGPMRDIVATIQPEQDEIVRAGADQTICVQGAPGTGKTAVGLHRAAWLLYAFRDRLARSGVLVIGPNRAFLEHIGAVLPALGEVAVGHTTIEELVASVPVRGTDPTATAALKGDARLAEVLRNAVWSAVQPATEPLVVPRGVRKWRVPAYEVNDILDELRSRGVRYDAARQMLPQRLAHAVLLKMEGAGDSPDDRVQDSVARSAVVKKYVGELWPALDAKAVLFALLSDLDELERHSVDLLTDDERRILVWDKPPRSKGAARWSRADAVLLDELGDHISRTPSLGHVVLDEAQDLSPMQLRAVGRRCSTGAATVLGDIAQGTTPWATDSWQSSLEHLGKPGSHVEVLDRGFRVPASVIEYAAQLLPHMAPGLGSPVSVRDNPGRLDLVPADAADLATRVAEVVTTELGEPGSIGVIAPDDMVQSLSESLRRNGIDHGVLGQDHGDIDHQVDLVPATVAKGLEFDRVVVVEPTAIAAAEPDERTGLRRLYVVLTRAVSALTVVHAEPLPTQLASA